MSGGSIGIGGAQSPTRGGGGGGGGRRRRRPPPTPADSAAADDDSIDDADKNDDDDGGMNNTSRHRHRRRRGVRHPALRSVPPLLALLGLTKFSTSFFLARRAVPQRSSCTGPGAAEELLGDVLGLSRDEVDGLVDDGLLVDHRRHRHRRDDANPKRPSEVGDLYIDGEEGGDYLEEGEEGGCWTPRSVDAVALIVVDALRFDFARDRLPKSIGSRLLRPAAGIDDTTGETKEGRSQGSQGEGRSRLMQFVADPPTVTMQRLKALTTGGLPTFADLSGSFGGADVDEDSWVQQLVDVPVWRRRRRGRIGSSRGRRGRRREDSDGSVDGNDGGSGSGSNERKRGAHMAFVGDDTWTDLFPHQFEPESFPYPSFNTRDLDTVDDGCMEHLPGLLRRLGGGSSGGGGGSPASSRGGGGGKEEEGEEEKEERQEEGEEHPEEGAEEEQPPRLELIVAHFLGVDHVGHTYGPRSRHMTTKLNQIDDALSYLLNVGIDSAPEEECRVALILGDHGMTEDGNHGGGTDEEVRAGLFAHYSVGCGMDVMGTAGTMMGGDSSGSWEEAPGAEEVGGTETSDAYGSVNQIDLVPTLSAMLGIPVPFANLGGLVPALVPPPPRRRGSSGGRRRRSRSSRRKDRDRGPDDGGRTEAGRDRNEDGAEEEQEQEQEEQEGGFDGDLRADVARNARQEEAEEARTTRARARARRAPETAVALALNAAQVWRYLTTYSETSNALPSKSMSDLEDILRRATDAYRSALAQSSSSSPFRSSSSEADGGAAADEDDGEEADEDDDTLSYRSACGLYKLFLSEATELGKRVWTRFDTDGMATGIVGLVAALLAAFPSWPWVVRAVVGRRLASGGRRRGGGGAPSSVVPRTQQRRRLARTTIDGASAEVAVALLLMTYQCAVLTFSNSYIENEARIIMFALAVLCIAVALRRAVAAAAAAATTARVSSSAGKIGEEGVAAATRIPPASSVGREAAAAAAGLPLLVALCSRINGMIVTGHGLDPSIRMHAAHNSAVFLGSLALLAALRWTMSRPPLDDGPRAASVVVVVVALVSDLASLLLLAFSWWEKRSPDHGRNGYLTCRAAMMLSLGGALALIAGMGGRPPDGGKDGGHAATSSVGLESKIRAPSRHSMHGVACVLFKGMIFIVAVTGPSTASSAILLFLQSWALRQVTDSRDQQKVPAPVLGALWRLAIRHAFFATGHACSFSRLHYSAAFVATDTFYFHTAGISLFMNTFGWEILGSILVLSVAKTCGRADVWRWSCFYQLLEAVGSCISVSLMRRHLMVWAIFAPRFVFAAVFTLLCLACWLAGLINT